MVPSLFKVPNHIHVNLKHFYLSFISLILTTLSSWALDPGYFAPSSVLAEGRWVKVEVKETGMQFISNTTLKSLGFSNPDKVNVYGYGGRMLPERLDTSTPDDLPVVVSLRTPSGIVFFGHSSIDWQLSSRGIYTHVANPYSDCSYYFISDRDEERPTAVAREDLDARSSEVISTFTECLVHEQDILAPSNSGRVILGEDFRTQRNRTFNFQLTDNTGNATVTTLFGAKVSNGTSTVKVTGNGSASTSMTIPGISNSDIFLNRSSCTLSLPEAEERLAIEVAYTNSGTLFTAALDYIEVTYPRELRLRNEELYFRLSPAAASEVVLQNCSESTVLWDVTDPVKPLSVTLHKDNSGSYRFVTPGGARNYVAFNPSRVARMATGAGIVRNQDLHAMEAPGMLVVAPEQFRTQAQKLADIHAASDGLKVTVVSPEEVYNEFSSGTPDVTAFRRLLKMWYDRAGGNPGDYTAFCLLFSRPTYDNKLQTPVVKRAGYPRIPIWQEPGIFTEAGSYSTDDYIGMLDDQEGSLNMGSAKIRVAVGRMPVKSVAEAENAIAKLEKYLLSPNLGNWRNNVMVIADDQDKAQHLKQAETVIQNMQMSENGADLVYEKLYLDAYPLGYSGQGAVYPEAKQRMMDKIAEGVSLIDYIGHANTRSWGHENLLTWTDITSMSNRNLPFLYAATCNFLQWDADEVSGAEEMWLNPEAGVIGMICPSRKVYISANGTLNAYTASWMFKRGADGLPLRLGEIMINGKNDSSGDTNKLRYAFMGDPSMRLPYPGYKVMIDGINGVSTDSDDYPELKARSRVTLSGCVTDKAGAIAEDFNGTVDIQLYDAEKVIETYGNGEDGEISTYNDRKTRLYTGRTTVKNGRWETEFIMPSEIENNYSPALFSLYAMNEEGEEANGSLERLYVYGFDTSAIDDNEGPAITDFYLNEPGFREGSSIGPNPVVYATLSDESGINLSEGGIGHRMTLSIDGKEWHEDLNLYYSPDIESFEKGKLSYPLQGIEPGDHTLTLTVWDNANNSSSSTLSFTVRADWKPGITELSTDVNPASTSVNFLISVDGSVGQMPCKLEVFDLGGKLLWSTQTSGFSESMNSLSYRWDLRDNNGRRVPRGIYLYRSTVTTPEGHVVTKTNKLAVTS